MAINCNCPNCGESYKLRDDFAGKRVTCKNPKCRQGFLVPEPAMAGPAVNVDELAASAFADEPIVEKTAEATIDVTCSRCDHKWPVEASKEGKNVLCPECRHPNRVPLRKQEKKADWRQANNDRPSLAKRDEPPPSEGAWSSGNAGIISQQTAREIVKSRQEEEEPEERRKRRTKRFVQVTLLVGLLGFGIYYLITARRSSRADGNIRDAVEEVKASDLDTDGKLSAIIHGAAGEFHARSALTKEEADTALKEFRTARNAVKVEASADGEIGPIMIDLAVAMVAMLGTTAEVDDGKRQPPEVVLKEIRQTLQKLPNNDVEMTADALRMVTRKLAIADRADLAGQLATQLFSPDTPEGQELLGQVGLELHRLKQPSAAKAIVERIPASTTALSAQALLEVLHPGEKREVAVSRSAQAIASAFSGDFSKARSQSESGGTAAERTRAITAIGCLAAEAGAVEAVGILELAAKTLSTDAKDYPGWLTVRVCRGLAQAGNEDAGEKLSTAVPNEGMRHWAKLAVLRGKLSVAKGKVDDKSTDMVGEPGKSAAASRAKEDVARHNAAKGEPYSSSLLNIMAKGVTRPFSKAGTLLGAQDRNLGK